MNGSEDERASVDDPWRQRLLPVLVALTAAVVVFVGAGSLPAPTPDDGGDRGRVTATDGVERLHETGVTGENVTVGVLDPTGFDRDAAALSGRVLAARSFAPGERPGDGPTRHGTAAATVVARTAPDAELYLASFDTTAGFRAGLDWLVRRDADIVVAPVGFYGKHGRADAVEAAVTRARRRGVLVVTPAGNLGRSRWSGAFSPDAAGVHRFDGGPRNYLVGDSRRVRLWLSWGAGNRSFRVDLYRVDGADRRLVARSEPYRDDGVPNARLVAEVDRDGTYYAVVRGPPAAAGTRLTLASPSHALQYRQRAGSVVPPATATGALAVGAVAADSGRVPPFSAAGPVPDGDGVDLVAPYRQPVPRAGGATVSGERRFEGTSAAAAYTAGVAALTLSAAPPRARDPAVVTEVLKLTAADAGPPGVDPVAGAGRVSPRRAVARARNATQNEL